MNAIDLLTRQHREVSSLFEQYEGEDDLEARRQLFIEIADALAAHTLIEERIFYPEVRIEQTETLLEQSVEDHVDIKRLIASLLDKRPGDPGFDAEMVALKDNVEKHVESEEGELFPIVRKRFSARQLSEMGDRLEALFDELAEEEPHKDIPAQTDEPASLD